MKAHREIILRKRTAGGTDITIDLENDMVTSIRRDQRQHRDFPIKMGWNFTNPKVLNDLKTWCADNDYYTAIDHIKHHTMSALDFAMGKRPPNGKIKFR